MGMPHGNILVHSVSNDLNPTTEAPSAGPNGSLGRLALEDNVLPKLEAETTGTSATTVVVDSISLSSGINGVRWTVVIESDDELNMRTSYVLAVWKDDGSSIEYAESSTPDIGDTDPVELSVILNGTNIELTATITGSDTWNIKSTRIQI